MVCVEQSRLELVRFALLSYPQLFFYCSTVVEITCSGAAPLSPGRFCVPGADHSATVHSCWLATSVEPQQTRFLSKYCWVLMESRLQRIILLSSLTHMICHIYDYVPLMTHQRHVEARMYSLRRDFLLCCCVVIVLLANLKKVSR